MMMRKITRHIYLLDEPRFSYPHSNSLWINDDIQTLIDNSVFPAYRDFARKHKFDLILNTHGHLDHYQDNQFYPDVPILIHELDLGLTKSGPNYAQEFGYYLLGANKLAEVFLAKLPYVPGGITGTYQSDQIINLGSTQIQIKHLPGHSAGHCGIFFPQHGVFYIADIDLSDFGPWYGNMHSSIHDFLNSIKYLIQLKPDLLIRGHGSGLIKENSLQLLYKYRDKILEREKNIVIMLKKGYNTIDEMARHLTIYGTLPPPEPIFYHYEKMMLWVHLQHLIQLGKVWTDNNLQYNVQPGISAYSIQLDSSS